MEKKRSQFWIGFVIGALLCVVWWYYQKSTSSEDAALNLLDELAAAKRQGGGETAVAADVAAPAETPADEADGAETAASGRADDLTAIHGIGPVYAQRLQEAGIHTFAALARLAPERVAEIVGRKNWQAADPAEWIAAAQELAGE
ncbi:MAG: DUF4332 domain-containing protein [Anaerolineales bacterium]|nr:DUF4332 domain-containing protein [Anaerolineales bacterium]